MIDSKTIKILCYILMGVAFLASGFLFIFGIITLIDTSSLGIALIVIALIIPLTTSISLYPIFALANIEERLLSIDQRVDGLLSRRGTHAKENAQSNDANQSYAMFASASELRKEPTTPPTYEEAVDFVNRKHGISLLPDDDLSIIKEKVKTIDDGGFTALIFKRKVSEATTKDEIESVFVMHAEEYD